MALFCEDEFRRETYLHRLGPSFSELQPSTQVQGHVPLTALEWFSESSKPSTTTSMRAADLALRDADTSCGLRIVLAPLSIFDDSALADLEAISQLYSFPSSVFSEMLQSVSFSFDSRTIPSQPGVEVSWSRFECKDIPPVDKSGRKGSAFGSRHDTRVEEETKWKMSYHFIHVRTRSDKSRCVTLLCFGASQELAARFVRLKTSNSWREVLQDPFLLHVIIFDELYIMLDKIAWNLADVFRPMERSTMQRAQIAQSSNSNRVDTVDFAGLHNAAKNCIVSIWRPLKKQKELHASDVLTPLTFQYLNEAADGVLSTLDSMLSHLQRNQADPKLLPASVQSLIYRKSMVLSTQLRLRSLSSRMNNIISLVSIKIL